MRNGVHVCAFVALVGLVAGHGACARYQAGPLGTVSAPSVLPIAPDRARYAPADVERSARLHASAVRLLVMDPRTNLDTRPLLTLDASDSGRELAAPERLADAITPRLVSLADGAPDAPAVDVYLRLESLRFARDEDGRTISAKLALGFALAGQAVSLAIAAENDFTLPGAPYDAAELDDLRRGACIELFDAILNDQTIDQLNAQLATKGAAAPASTGT